MKTARQIFVRFSKTRITNNKTPFGGNKPTINRNPYHRLLRCSQLFL